MSLTDPPLPSLSPEEIDIGLKAIDCDRKRYVELGILEREDPTAPVSWETIQEKRDVLSVYLRDVREKNKVLEDLAKKVGLLTRILTGRLLNKTVEVKPKKGLVFRSSTGQVISPSHLSSGEQHEFILVYELLFKARENGLVLIDEPEMSLHLEWQDSFLKNIWDIVHLSGVDVVLATHAPAIIGEHWDLTVRLGEPG